MVHGPIGGVANGEKVQDRKIGRELITREILFFKMVSFLYIFQIFLQKKGYRANFESYGMVCKAKKSKIRIFENFTKNLKAFRGIEIFIFGPNFSQSSKLEEQSCRTRIFGSRAQNLNAVLVHCGTRKGALKSEKAINEPHKRMRRGRI